MAIEWSEETEETGRWLKKIFGINRELDCERKCVTYSLNRIHELERQKEEIYSILRNITNPTHKQILHMRYVQGEKWEDIAEEMHYELPHLHRIHKKAVVEVDKIRRGL